MNIKSKSGGVALLAFLFALCPCVAPAASTSGSNTANVTIPDAGGYVSSTITISGAPAGAVVTGIDVYFRCSHTYSSDLVVDLNADAQGSLGNHTLWNREGGSADNPTRTVSDISTFNGLSVNRTWYLYAKDFVAGDSGYIDEWTITIYYSAPLAPPTITSPGTATDTSYTTNLTPTFKWNSVSGASKYGLYVSKYPYGSGNLIYSNTTLTGTSFVFPSGILTNGGKYRWQMTTWNSSGVEGAASSLLYFQTAAAALAPPNIISPGTATDTGYTTNLTPTFKWNSVSGASKYGLYLSRYPYGSGNLIYSNTTLTGTSFVFPSGILTNGGKYRWQMTTWNSGGGEGAASSLLYFQTAAAPLAPPTITSPGTATDTGYITNLTPTFRWDAVTEASKYGLYMSRFPYGSGNLIYSNTTLTGTSFVLPSGILTNGGKYRWQMTTWDSSGVEGTTSSLLYFQTTAAPLAPPNITSPGTATDTGHTTNLTPTFRWDAVTGASKYGMYMSKYPYGSGNLVYSNTTLTGTSFVLPSGILTNGGKYRWQMTTWDSGGVEGAASSLLYFQTTAALLAPPNITSPGTATDTGYTTNLTPTFRWDAVTGANRYGLYMSKYPYGSGNLIYSNTTLTGTSFVLSSGILTNGGKYRWQMTTWDSGGVEGTTSSLLYFQTMSSTTGIPSGFYLAFPLQGHSAFDAAINSIFDHSMVSPYAKDDVVIAFNGERGTKANGWDGDAAHPGLQNAGHTNFWITGHYAGAGAPSYLNYDGHPGIDYVAAIGTPVYAPADGVIHYPESIPGISDATAYHTLAIDHGNGYVTYLLHLSTYPSVGNAVVAEGATVVRGALVGYSGDAGAAGSPHLHFEEHHLGIPVDPYGWTGGGPDPYTSAVSASLWEGGAAPTGQYVLGIDVSVYQGAVDWHQVSTSGGKSFAMVRASAGINTTDGRFIQNVEDAVDEGVLVGAYHFAYPEYFTAQQEAQKFLAVAASYTGEGYLPPALDIEDSPAEDSYPSRMGKAALSQWILDWCTEVERVAGAKPIIYTTRYYARNYLASSLDQHLYWVVTDSGAPDSDPGDLGIWETWIFQQYRYGESGGTCDGVAGVVDLDSFNGDLADLQALTKRVPVLSGGFSGPSMTFSWPTSATGYVVEVSTSLFPAVWTPLISATGVVDDTWVITNAPTGPAAFYRLRRQ